MTSALQGDRLDFLLERLAKDKPLPLDLDQKKRSVSRSNSTIKTTGSLAFGSQPNVGSLANVRPPASDARTRWSANHVQLPDPVLHRCRHHSGMGVLRHAFH
jgi:hypothetical protein